jgi:hypothetical protein
MIFALSYDDFPTTQGRELQYPIVSVSPETGKATLVEGTNTLTRDDLIAFREMIDRVVGYMTTPPRDGGENERSG